MTNRAILTLEKKPYKLPKKWEWTKLGEVASIIMGQSPPSNTYNQNKRGLPFYQGKVDFQELYPSPRVWCTKPNKIAEAGDILISVRAPVGPVNMCKEKSCIGRGLAAIRPGNNILGLFLFYYLKSIERNWTGRGSTFKAIKKVDLQRLLIPLPPFEEQRCIVRRLEQLLSKVEEARRLRRQARAEAEQIMQVALHKVFSRAEEEGWEWVRLEDIAETMNGLVIKQVPSKREGFPISRIETIQDWRIDPNRVRFVNVSKDLFEKFRYKIGDILFSHINSFELVGKAAIYEGEPENLIHGMNLLRIRVKDKDRYNPHFLYMFFRTNFFRKQLEPYIKRAIGQSSINQTNLKNLEIPFPLPEEQKRIVTYFNKIRETVESLKKLQQRTDEELEKLVPAVLGRAFRGLL